MFRRPAWSAAVLLTMMSSAFAADLAYKGPPAPVAPLPGVYDWSGFYVGANVGGAFGSTSNLVTGTDSNTQAFLAAAQRIGVPMGASLSPKGWAAGVEMGFDFQTGQWVLGAIARFDELMSVSDSVTAGGTIGRRTPWSVTYGAGINNLSQIGAKIGYADFAGLPIEVFAIGGPAFGGVNALASGNGGGFGVNVPSSTVAFGWFVGAGVAYGITPHWSVSVDYTYTDLGSHNYTASVAGLSFVDNVTYQVQQVLGGIHYKF